MRGARALLAGRCLLALLTVLIPSTAALAGTKPPQGGHGHHASAPRPPRPGSSFTWTVPRLRLPHQQQILAIELSGCWRARDVSSISGVSTSPQGRGPALSARVDGRTGTIVVGLLRGARLPLTIRVSFRPRFAGARTGTQLLLRTGGKRADRLVLRVGGPLCPAPQRGRRVAATPTRPAAGGQKATATPSVPSTPHAPTPTPALATATATIAHPASATPAAATAQPATATSVPTPPGATATPMATPTPTAPPTATQASTATASPTALPTATAAATSTATPTNTGTASATSTATGTATTTATATATTTMTTTTGGGPSDLSASAPPVDQSVATSLISATQFLYSGPNPVQTGVASGTIELTRTAVLRGVVLSQEGQALPGVTITVLDHPEFGQTLSRASGQFDLAVNGGGLLTVNYAKDGYLPAQRQVQAPWQDYAILPEVRLVAYDPHVSAIDLSASNSAPVQVAQGSMISDSDGMRQATLLFTQGTTATMALSNGATQPLSGTLHVRATEFTVGPGGPQAMPAPLPPSSGYTYAADFSVDEASAAGATGVQFSQPVPVYVQNFLGFPVGGIVPAGYYDRQQGRWVPSQNGLVIGIVDITNTNGISEAELDLGAGQPATPTALAALGITDAERAQLAQLYQPGQSLWRVPITHFSPHDFNWPYGPPPDAKPPNQPPPTPPHVDGDCQQAGSIIGCENQTLGEEVHVGGTDFSLSYGSDRVPGRREANTLRIPLSGSSVPASLKRIDLEVLVAGRRFSQSVAAAPNQSYLFTWDGIDAYGRIVQGQQPVTVRIGYVYGTLIYQDPVKLGQVFGALSGVPISGGRGRAQDTILWQVWHGAIGPWDARAQGLGGWTLSVHHAYDPVGRTLYLGDGTRRSSQLLGPTINTAVGNGQSCSSATALCGDGGPARKAQLSFPDGVAVGPDGSLYIADANGFRIRRVAPDGTISTVAGNGQYCPDPTQPCGDGGAATAAQLNGPYGIAIGPDGSLYFTDDPRVRRVAPDGTISTVAGNGQYCPDPTQPCGDGGPATAASFNGVDGITVGPDGSLYVADSGDHRIRRIAPDGTISTVAGNGGGCISGSFCSFSGDGGPASAAHLSDPNDVAIGPDGSLYIADSFNYRIRRVGPDGIITTVAGGGQQPCTYGGYRVYDCPGDGGPATAATLDTPTGVAVGADGTLYIAQEGSKVRMVTPDGIISTFAGTAMWGYGGDGGPAAAALLDEPHGLALAPDGSLYIVDRDNYSVRRVAPAWPGLAVSDVALPSADGREVYIFDGSGRHLRTLDALTGAVRYRFGYDAAGRLSSVTDGDNNVTTIERDGSGNPTAIVAPGGQRTSLSLDANGFLAAISDPLSHTTTLTSTADGLLSALSDPNGNTHTFSYDAVGRLVLDQDPAGGSTRLARTEGTTGYTVTVTTALSRTTTYRLERLATGGTRMTTTDPSGARTVAQSNPDGSQSATFPDGPGMRMVNGPDSRWGMLAPVLSSATYTTTGGLTETVLSTRSVALANPDDPFSLRTMTDTLSINGQTSTHIYAAATRTITSTTAAGRQSVTTLDAQGRVVQIAPDAGLAPLVRTYDSQGRVQKVRQGAQSWTYTFDAQNRVTARTDAAGEQTQYGYDAAGHVITQTLPGGETYRFTYDANGNRTAVIMPSGAVHHLAYTALDQPAGYTPPDTSTSGYARSYTPDRELLQISLPDGRTVDRSYDPGGRLISLADADVMATYGYAPSDPTARVSRIAVTPTVGLTQTLGLSYDGNLLTGMTWAGAAQGQYRYRYDNTFALAGSTLTSGTDAVTTTVRHDADGLLTAEGPFTFDRSGPDGATSQISDGTLTRSLGYDALDRVAAYTDTVGSSQPYAAQVAYDAAGRIAQKTETVLGVTHIYSYTYDLDGQLSAVWRDGTPIEQYAYDPNGNRTRVQIGSTAPLTASYDTQDRLLQQGAVHYTFDADGYLTQRGADSFHYSAQGELITATVGSQTITYSYDGLGRRVARSDASGTTQYLYGNPANPLQVTAVRDASGTLTTLTYDEPGLLVAVQRSGAWYYVSTDGVGTPRVVTDASGTVTKTLEYDSFGTLISDSNPAFALPLGFAGGLADPASGLVHFWWRDYDPASGRWTARDPLLFEGSQTNLYAYVSNNPITLRDPLGLDSVGFSAYSGVGGGIQLTHGKDGWGICFEIGFGFGASLEFGYDTPQNSQSVAAEAQFTCGPFSATAGLSLDSCGNLSSKLKGKAGPLKFGNKPFSELDEEKLGLGEMGAFFKGSTCSIQGKLAAQVCRKF